MQIRFKRHNQILKNSLAMILRCFFRIRIFDLPTDIDSRALPGPPSTPLSKITLESKKTWGLAVEIRAVLRENFEVSARLQPPTHGRCFQKDVDDNLMHDRQDAQLFLSAAVLFAAL